MEAYSNSALLFIGVCYHCGELKMCDPQIVFSFSFHHDPLLLICNIFLIVNTIGPTSRPRQLKLQKCALLRVCVLVRLTIRESDGPLITLIKAR